MKNIVPIIAIILLGITITSCSKDNPEPSYRESMRIDYIFAPQGVPAQITIFSNKDGQYVTDKSQSLYRYTDEVRPGDKITLRMQVDERAGLNQEIRVMLAGKQIFIATEPNTGSIPPTWVIDETLDKKYFLK